MTQKPVLTYFESFKNRDHSGMAGCYAEDATFCDPVFGDLTSKEVRAMWHMLVLRGKETKITFTDLNENETHGSANWIALYPYGPKRYPVRNVVSSQFELRDHKIVKQVDTFDLQAWCAMALGWPGKLLGWTPWFQNKVRATARRGLKDFISKHPEYK